VPLIFDSHLDLAWNALAWKRDLLLPLDELNAREAEWTDQKFRGRATTCLPEMRRGQVAVCLGTMMARVPYGKIQVHGDTLDFPTHEQAFAYAQAQSAYYNALEWSGAIRPIETAGDLQAHWDQWKSPESEIDPPIGLILAMEGADAIVSPEQAAYWFDIGLRCASLVHYGTSAYAVGTGEDGPITDLGRALLKEFESLGIVLDLTHLCDTSFFQAIDAFGGPVCASHQACRALVPGQRQFTDEQLKIIIDRGGVIGVPCDAWMLYPGWIRGESSREVVAINALADHVDHVCQLAGNSHHVSIGSDLDGGFGTEQTPTGLDSIADLQKLDPILSQRGYTHDDVEAILGENWLRFFLEHVPVNRPFGRV
jgi:membrane dipeptidase